jgi:hypothetical protein
MRHLKLILSGIGILASVGTVLAFTEKPFDQGTVYCNSVCTDRIDYRVSCTGVTNPCGGTTQEYVKTGCNTCVASSGPFEVVATGK